MGLSTLITKEQKTELLTLAGQDNGSGREAVSEPATRIENLTDTGNAKRLIARYKVDLRFCYALGAWFIWNGRRWLVDEGSGIHQKAKSTTATIYAEAANCPNGQRRQAIAGHALRSEGERSTNAMISMARDEPGVPLKMEELDSDKWLINCINGTLNLKSGILQPHTRSDLITKIIPVTYDPKAKCPRWDAYLGKVMNGDARLIHYTQKVIGYSLTGDVSEQVIFILHGRGSNGKTVFITVMNSMFGDYATTTPTETLLMKRSDQIPNDIARLKGARFVTAVENEKGRRLAEALVKRLTGGDKITARFLNHEFFEFYPVFKLFLVVNDLPNIRGTDHAIWRRIREIPFMITIPEAEQEKWLADKLIEKELPGILRWAVEGCLAWQRDGLKSPEAVKSATEHFREDMDILGTFLDERCFQGPEATVTAKAIYESYTLWAEENGEPIIRKIDFGSELKKRGFRPDRNNQGRYWWGVTLT